MKNTIESLQWRYSVKKFDPKRKLSAEQVDTVLESLRLSASSFGLQPWHFVVVENPELRQELLAHSWKQKQVVEASHVIVFCTQTDFTEEHIQNFMTATAKTRGQPIESLDGYAKVIQGFLNALDSDKLLAWQERQVYLALGSLLAVCAIEEIDACPMEGFAPKEYDRVLGLADKGLRSVVVCTLGFRDESDGYQKALKVRYEKEQVITHV